jgi:hypothetical protein
MRCPSCHQNIRVQGKFCPKCGEQIFGLPVRGPEAPPAAPIPPAALPSFDAPPPPPPPPARLTIPPPPPSSVLIDDDLDLEQFPPAPPSEPVLDITLDDTPASPVSPAQGVGETCPYCRFPIKSGEAVQICPSCGVPHHLDCWRENGGCTVYGCRSSPAMAAAAPAAAAPPPVAAWPSPGAYQSGGLPREALALLEAELDRLATNALVFALLGFLGLTAVIGLLTGISVLGQISHSGLPARGARGKAWAAVALSAFWLIAMAGLLAVLAEIAGGFQ